MSKLSISMGMILELKEANKKHLFLPREWVYHVLDLPEGKYEITKLKRSDLQNKYYFGVTVKAWSDYTSFTKEEMHQTLAKKFLFYERKVKGKVYTFVKSTASLNTKEFNQYNKDCQLYGAEWGIDFISYETKIGMRMEEAF